jgi:hypothetical protein
MEYIMSVFTELDEMSLWLCKHAEEGWLLHTLTPLIDDDQMIFTVILQRDPNP